MINKVGVRSREDDFPKKGVSSRHLRSQLTAQWAEFAIVFGAPNESLLSWAVLDGLAKEKMVTSS